jgi:Flp pilus assembly pilin Flp
MEKKLAGGLLRREEGQTMVEYSIVAALIAVVAMAAVQALGVGITGVFNNIVQSITSV